MTQDDTAHADRFSKWTRITLPPWPEAAILVAATVIRLWRLGYHSVWFDESVSLKWAQSDAAYIWQVTFPLIEDKHPPLYYLLLHFWRQALDPLGLATSDVALRTLGSILGVLTVAGVMLLAGRLADRRTGLLAGTLVAAAPLLVWYSQELRMFQPATTAIVWSACALLMAWSRDKDHVRFLWWAVFVLCLLSALYSYLFSAFMLPAAGATLLALAYERRSVRFFFEGTIALAVVAAAYLPLAYNAWLVNASESTPGTAFADFAVNTYHLMQVFTVWRAPWSGMIVPAAVAVYGVLALTGLALPEPRTRLRTTIGGLDIDQVWIAVWLLTPVLIANLLLSRSGSVFSEDRYLLFLAPFFLWAVARGVTTLAARSRSLGWAAGAAAIIPLAAALPILWTPAMARENWRAAANYVAEYHRANVNLGDAVIAHVDYTHEPLEWYLRQQATFDELPVFFPYGGTLQPEQVDEVVAPPLRGLVDFGAQTAWLTQSHLEGVDDQRLVEQWLAEHHPIITEQYPAGIKLSGYMLKYRYSSLPVLGDHTVYPGVEVAPGIALAACEIIPSTVEARDETMHPPSGWAHLRLWWRSEQPVDKDYVTTAQIVGPEGIWGDRLHRNGEALDMWPTSQWVPGEYVREEIDINLNPVTPPGQYPVLVGLSTRDGTSVTAPVSCDLVEIR